MIDILHQNISTIGELNESIIEIVNYNIHIICSLYKLCLFQLLKLYALGAIGQVCC